MSYRYTLTLLLAGMLLVSRAIAADYSVAALNEPPPAEELSAEIVARLETQGVRVTRGSSTTFCDIWLCKGVEVKADFQPTGELLYPFTPGQLIGAARFARKGADFRDQDIESGVYTLRFAHQPVDGAHVGTSPTRDFLLLSQASKDKSPAQLEYKPLTQQSAEAAGSSHPAMLCMQTVSPDTKEFPAMVHNEEHDWWILALPITTAGGQAKSLPMAVVVYGVAAE